MSPQGAAVWPRLRPDDRGLVVVVVQHAQTDQILMVGYMNEAALGATLQHRRVTFWSRSRNALWEKGESSGNTLQLESLRIDCDADALLIRAHPTGPTCHTGTTSCFFQSVELTDGTAGPPDDGPPPQPGAVLATTFATIERRKAGRGATAADGQSYVRVLLGAGVEKICAKIREEAGELCQALVSESAARVASETADLVFHAMVGLAHRDLHWRDVAAIFAQRLGTSGIDEKRNRTP
jgi:phosphoribosyl-ATP pyrophosphohydrolase/phosphoribosyl-AMP cyclohydrolase